MNTIFYYLLASNYSFASRWVNPKYGGDVIWTSVHGFLTPISVVAVGLHNIFVDITGVINVYEKSWPNLFPMATVNYLI
ncbi:MAG: hypothetical protein WA810_10770 [Maribacter sp.]